MLTKLNTFNNKNALKFWEGLKGPTIHHIVCDTVPFFLNQVCPAAGHFTWFLDIGSVLEDGMCLSVLLVWPVPEGINNQWHDMVQYRPCVTVLQL